MSAAAALSRVGRCPGALRPMASGDGLIVRIKPRGGTLTPDQATGIAAASMRFGNGALDLTSRANLQIRGVAEDGLPGLTAALGRLHLLDASPEAEARRNVVVSPLAGLDPSAAFDIRPMAAALEGGLAADPSLAGLPAKFSFSVSDGGALRLDDVPADVRFEACSGADGRPAFAVRLDGDGGWVARCPAAAISDIAVRLARAFVAARGRDPELRRMRDLVARDRADTVFGRVGLACEVHRGRERAEVRTIVGLLTVIASVAKQSSPSGLQPGLLRREAPRNDGAWTGAPADPSSVAARHPGTHIGLPRWDPILPDGEKGRFVLGVGAPFGRLDAAQLRVLAQRAAEVGASELRLTPGRAILVPGLNRTAAAALAKTCASAGLIVDPDDPSLRVAACTGAPGCHRGTTPTLDHAARWVRHVEPGQGIALHVSGCAKGCAHPGPAPLTLVGCDGRYDIVVDGRPGDAPTVRGLDANEARLFVRTILRRDRHP